MDSIFAKLETIFNKHNFTLNKNVMFWIDHSDSMIAFNELLQEMFEDTDVYYFKNLPLQFLGNTNPSFDWVSHFETQNIFTTKNHLNSIKLKELLENNKNTTLIILSDVGVAKRSYSNGRICATKGLLKMLEKYNIQTAILNPMPIERWKGTSAEEISKVIPMFEFKIL